MSLNPHQNIAAICAIGWRADEMPMDCRAFTMNRPYQSAVDLASEPDFVLGGVQIRPSSREVLVRGQQEVLEPRVMQRTMKLSYQHWNPTAICSRSNSSC
jgi:hypothetical protein